MKITRRVTGGAGAAVLLTALLAAGSSASATVSGAVPFSSADFSGYATGTEVHLNAATLGQTNLVDLEQALSGASTTSATAGLTNLVRSETGTVVQPSTPNKNSYATGSGLEVGLGTSTTATADPNQLALAGKVVQTSTPNGPLQDKKLLAINAAPIIQTSFLESKAATFYDSASCPIGQPLAYGFGNAANVSALDLVNKSTPTIGEGNGTSVAQSTAYNVLTPNGDGTFGLTSEATETVAPVEVNLLNVVKLDITVAGKDPNSPIGLIAKTTGEGSGGSVSLVNGGLVTITLSLPGMTTPAFSEVVNLNNPTTLGPKGFVHIPLSLGSLGNALNQLSNALGAALNGNTVTGPLAPLFGPGGPLNGVATTAGNSVSSVLSKLADVSLGYVDIDAVPHKIGSPPQGSVQAPPAVVVGGTQAAGAIDLVDANLQLSGSLLGVKLPSELSSIDIAHLYAGHLEASANLTAPINCQIPVVKTSSASTVQAGQSFTYTINVPDPAQLAALACNLSDLTVTDTITDDQGTPTFEITSTAPTGTVAPLRRPLR